MSTIIIFGGTTEGRQLAEICLKNNYKTIVCVASEYGEEQMEGHPGEWMRRGRLESAQMEKLFQEELPSSVIDATHPFAQAVSENIEKACTKTNTSYLRLLREHTRVQEEQAVYVDTPGEAADYLNQCEGNILLTTGSKQLAEYVNGIKDTSRLYVRTLPSIEAIEICHSQGITGAQIIAMQGPFTQELNVSLIHQFQIQYLVTKEAGGPGGYCEKINAAKETGTKVVVLKRPTEERGFSYEEILAILGIVKEHKRELYLVGVGMGNPDSLTAEGKRVIQQADVLFGGRRLLAPFAYLNKPMEECYQGNEIKIYLSKHTEWTKVVVCLSGDVGFYSGAKKLLEEFQNEDVKVICGISSLVYFAAAIQKDWQDARMVSAHGRTCNIVEEVRANRTVFALAGNSEWIQQMCCNLKRSGLEHVKIWMGTNLGYEEEQIREGSVDSFSTYNGSDLTVLWIENKYAEAQPVYWEIPDQDFIRGQAPMTKQEVRTLAIAKLRLTRNSIVYDIGAGTGSVAVSCGKIATAGRVFAIEKKQEVIPLLKANREKFLVENMEIIAKTAGEALAHLPKPTHAFIGGTSGEMDSILRQLLKKNPGIRVVVTIISLETLTELLQVTKKLPIFDLEIIQVMVGKAKSVANHHMMMGTNPVFIVSFTGGCNE
ncbi:MAG: precorrin-6A reductase [Lachnospiraceae bacterium]